MGRKGRLDATVEDGGDSLSGYGSMKWKPSPDEGWGERYKDVVSFWLGQARGRGVGAERGTTIT